MKVAAVIPVYNGMPYIKQTLEALLNQTTPLQEIIVVDDASTDGTLNMLLQIQRESEIPIIIRSHELNKGVSVSRNEGIRCSNSEWILFMDADDVAVPTLLETHIRNLLLRQELTDYRWVLAHSAYQQIDENGKRLEGTHRFRQVGPEEILGYQFIRNHVYLSGTLVEKQAVLDVGGFNVNLAYSEDWDLWLKLARIGGYVYTDDLLFFVRRHASNASSLIRRMVNGEQNVLQQYTLEEIREAIFRRQLPEVKNAVDYAELLFRLNYLNESKLMLEDLLRRNIAMPDAVFMLGNCYLKQGNYAKARDAYESVLKDTPNHGAALNNKAAVDMLLGELAVTRSDLERALELHPGYIDAEHNIKRLGQHGIPLADELRFTSRPLRAQLLRYRG
ncbi:glycosyltransferase [Paenibacillus albus]|uniref:Glycosyltransferase n=1 Tax=Paenibacillus albus TaxID=2495582 RepID=A0A3S8ZYD1_9BACL|nr:glycosyltransferase [Paenibacillus albus]AZN38499.1 glycosyltransferase [Paenibacillus albus]